MNIKCYFCGGDKISSNPLLGGKWITENQYLGNDGQSLRKQIIGGGKDDEEKEIISTVYYCSMECMEEKNDERDRKEFSKGKCKKCKISLVVMNDDCYDLEHKKEMKYMVVPTPECMTKPRPPKKENCWEIETKKFLCEKILPLPKEEREEAIAEITFNFKVAGDNPRCKDCRDRTLALFKEWKELNK